MEETYQVVNLDSRIFVTKTLLESIVANHAPATFANSFGAEDVVLTDLITRFAPAIEIFSLDTGRLPAETYALMQTLQEKRGLKIKVYYPDSRKIENFIETNGPNAFYNGLELRKQCCAIRKVEPLRRALAGKQAWLTGLRKEQAPTRSDLTAKEWDADHNLYKFNPLIDWSHEDVWAYIRKNNIPYNALHDQGYPSIGCAPCTRAISSGEDLRAGRWWWERPEDKECGLHVHKRKLVGSAVE